MYLDINVDNKFVSLSDGSKEKLQGDTLAIFNPIHGTYHVVYTVWETGDVTRKYNTLQDLFILEEVLFRCRPERI